MPTGGDARFQNKQDKRLSLQDRYGTIEAAKR
jgi:hypothetical protein